MWLLRLFCWLISLNFISVGSLIIILRRRGDQLDKMIAAGYPSMTPDEKRAYNAS